MEVPSKKLHICTNFKKKGQSIENCWDKGGGKEGQGPKQKKRSKFKKKKGKEKVNGAKESSSDGKSDGSVAFINYDCVAFIKDSTGATVIIDMGVSSHMTPRQNLLKNYQSFPKLRTIRGADKGTFDALNQFKILSMYASCEKLIDLEVLSHLILRLSSQCSSPTSFILKIFMRSALISSTISSLIAVIIRSSMAMAMITKPFPLCL